jgi:hypothetical protein
MKPGTGQARRRIAASAALLAAAAVLLLVTAHLASAEGGDALSDLLLKAQSNVEKFVEDFSYLRYEEDFVQQKLTQHEKVAYKRETVFDSIIRMHYEEGKLRIDEQRIPEKNTRRVESRPLLSTYGFSTLAMIFHPYYQSSFRFTRLEDGTLQGTTLARIHFEHIPSQPSPVLYQMIGADKPLELTGTAWIDPTSGEIHRIEAALSLESNDLGLKAIRADLSYAPVTLQDESAPHLLPAVATIDLETPRQHWRNIHHFVDYRKYRVTTNMPGASTQ